MYTGRIEGCFFQYPVFSNKNTIILGFLNSSSPLTMSINVDRNTPLKSEPK
ncbi:hypothetical protein HanRHA438_Chr04g0189541 [Helianthus annuus]|nr:hypothetical protein HanHA300_Chr04g0147061 [Helianthus annuus]KAJ0597949.1 hypothetical protein HanHA89_Chr04g0160421 [Helianthus annuus]KAJ0758578.1 hypothetical protein HanLR1_Chr04g0151981 [Helianthus annuus]KAJ0928030.1 hypothetical protein HanRHA438_Chr04g0189541 [Helianthus annuus]